jgi:uncharacterized protein YecT (DUF1311 family)
MNKLTQLIIVVIISITFPTLAISKTYDDCLDKATSTVSIINCISSEYIDVYRKIQGSYADLLKILPSLGQEKLKKSQQAWVKFRDNECDLSSYKASGATQSKIILGTCYIEMTKERLSTLENYKKWYFEKNNENSKR